MRVERFQESDMRSAMAKVRNELGDEAVIISSRRVEGRTEIMAAIDYDPSQLESAMKTFTEANKPKKKVRKRTPKVNTKRVWDIVDNSDEQPEEGEITLTDMQHELGKLRKLFEGELAQLAWRDEGKRQPNRLALVARLEAAGISRACGTRVVDKVLPCADLELGWRRSLRMLSRSIKTPTHDVMKDGGVIALIGSTGVGKTTTAAKIAAQFSLLHGKNKVAFISTDDSRVGGQEQLISLGSSLGVPVQVATSREQMQNILASFSERKLIIIDTAGLSQRNTSLLENYQKLTVDGVKIHPYLVLSATSQESIINETIKAYAKIKLTAAIITKIDETGGVGPVLSSLLENKLAVSFFGTGQKIPEDLEEASAETFINSILNSYSESANRKPNKSLVKKVKKTIVKVKRKAQAAPAIQNKKSTSKNNIVLARQAVHV